MRQNRKLQEREAKQAKVKDDDAEAEDDQTKKKECEDCDRDEEDVESEYSLDDESIFTKADKVKVKEKKRSKKGEVVSVKN